MSSVIGHQSRLDSASVFLVRWPWRFANTLKELEITTFGEVRALMQKWYVDPPDGFSPSTRRLLEARFSRHIYCENCGAPMMLYRDTQLCEVHGPGCERSKPITRNSTLHKAFPDRIVK